MFILIDGIMGSGKTYYAVNLIKDNLTKYHKVFTNINGFKFDKFSNVKQLYFDYTPDGSLSLLGHFEHLKEIYDTPNTNDNHLHEYLLENDFISLSSNDYKPFLVVIDEAQNYFDKKTDLLIWMQTYHRHLFSDFILITQSASLLHFSYLKQFEYFIHSLPLSRQLTNSKFKYQKHISFPYRDGKYGTVVDTITIPKKDDIFDIYHSGDKVRTKSVLHKYIYILIFFVVLIIVLSYFVISYFFSPAKTPTNNIDSNHSKTINKYYHKSFNVKPSFNIDKNTRYIRIKCFKYSCYGDDIFFDLKDLDFLLKNTNSKMLHSKVLSKGYSELYLIASKKFLDLFKKGVQNDKNFNFNPISSITGSK